MAINTPLGDTLDGFLGNLLAGKSAITNWHSVDVGRCYSKVGADSGGYDWAAKLQGFEGVLPPEMFRRARKLVQRAPWATKLSVLLALDAYRDARMEPSTSITALRCAIDEIRYHDLDAAVVVGAVLDFPPAELHAMALMGAITFQSFNDDPQRASRPYDTEREGFVPAHGGGAIVIEKLEAAQKRGATIYAELLGVEAGSDANHLPQPSELGQAKAMTKFLRACGVAPEQIDYISAHATSTPLGDLTELRSIKRVFGDHAKKLEINAPKSLLGHTCWAAPTVETVAAVIQMRAGNAPIAHPVKMMMKNSFGFGGINSVGLIARYEGR